MEAMSSARGDKSDRNNEDKKEAEEEAAQLANAANEKATAKEETEVVDIEELLFK